MTATMTFGQYDKDAMFFKSDDGKNHQCFFSGNKSAFKYALIQVASEDFRNAFVDYENNLSQAHNIREEEAAAKNYDEKIKKLLRENWDAVYPIVADKLR